MNYHESSYPGYTPLHRTMVRFQQAVAVELLASGADVNAKSSDGSTALHLAVERLASVRGYEVARDAIRFLLEQPKIDVNAKTDIDGATPLVLVALSVNYCDSQQMTQLLAARARVDVVDNVKRTPLHWAAHNGHYECAEELIRHGAKVNVADRHGSSPLHLAARQLHHKVVKLLIDNRADVNAADNDKRSPLHEAVMRGDTSFVFGALLEGGANIRAQDKNGSSVLHMAMQDHVKYGLLSVLLDHGADVNAQDDINATPLHTAVLKRHGRDLIEFLVNHGAQVDAV